MLKFVRRVVTANPSTAATVVVAGGVLAVIGEWILASKLWMYMIGPAPTGGWGFEIIFGGLIANILVVIVGGCLVWAGTGLYEIWKVVRKEIIAQGQRYEQAG